MFAHRVAAMYVGQMVLGDGRVETGNLPIVGVEFQTNPEHEVDDLLVVAGAPGEETRVSIAVRRAPRFAASHAKTRDLVAALVREVLAHLGQERHRVAVAVAGSKSEYDQVQQLAQLARGNADEAAFHAQLYTDGRWSGPVRSRYAQLKDLVAAGRPETPSEDQARDLTWQLLVRLWLVQLRVEAADESDWAQLANSMSRVVRDGCTGVELRDRLATWCGQFDLTGTAVDARVVRHAVHPLLDPEVGRFGRGWIVLQQMRAHARAAVRDTLGPAHDGDLNVSLDRAEQGARLASLIREAGTRGTAVVVQGVSGTGKSALVLAAVEALHAQQPESFEALVVNLRRLPDSVAGLTGVLERGLGEFLADLSAPSRVLVIDAADVVLEGRVALLHDLAVEARRAGAGLIVVTADTATEVVLDQISPTYETVHPFEVALLTDTELETVAARLPQLSEMLHDLSADSLLRRLVVLDLLSRSDGALTEVVNDWQCLQLVWEGLVRRRGSSETGSPEARERALLAIAEEHLGVPPSARSYPDPDPAALDALRRDQLVAPAGLFDHGPQFAHEEVRRYATAVRLIKTPDLGRLLDQASGPRWALSAAQLACLGHLERADPDPSVAFAQMAATFTALAAEYGPRWADVVVDAALDSPHTFEHLQAVLPSTPTSGVIGLDNVLRVIQQRHDARGQLDLRRYEPVVCVLLSHDAPWSVSKRAFPVLISWLHALILAEAPAGHAARVLLRRSLLDHWNTHNTPTAVVARRGLDPVRRPAADPSQTRRDNGQRRRRHGLNHALLDEQFVALLALLAADIDDQVASRLDTIAHAAPAKLAPAVDAPLAGMALAQHDPNLLLRMARAYYIDDSAHGRRRNHGVRDHDERWSPDATRDEVLLLGPFMTIFTSLPLSRSVAFLNDLLNHATRRRTADDIFPRGRGTAISMLRTSKDQAEGTEGRTDGDTDRRTTVLQIDGSSRPYWGDEQVWTWYRGSTTGPVACASALQALEQLLDDWLDDGVPLAPFVRVLLRGCENLAVPGLLVGVAVRHLERAGGVMDRFLADPMVWHLEFRRFVYERMGLGRAGPAPVINYERRTWTFREVCMHAVMWGDEARRDELRRVGNDLLAAGRAARLGSEIDDWAGYLDGSRYRIRRDDGNEQVLVEVAPAPELVAQQAEWARESERNNALLRIQNRYWIARHRTGAKDVPPSAAEITADLALARESATDPPTFAATDPLRPLTHVAAAAVRRTADGDPAALGDHAAFVVDLFLSITDTFAEASTPREDHQYFEMDADRAVAAALPCLLLPALHAAVEAAGHTRADVDAAALVVAQYGPWETRLHLARGCDRLWAAPCTGDPCLHQIALRWATESARYAEIAVGPWDHDSHCDPVARIDGDVLARLHKLDGDAIDTPALEAAIRACGAAASTDSCIASLAAEQLAVLLAAQRRGMLAQDNQGDSVDHYGNESLVTARALLLTHTATGPLNPLLAHLTALRTNAGLLTGILHGLTAAGAETPRLSQAARAVWPDVVRHVLRFTTDDPKPFRAHPWGSWALAALLPQPLAWANGLYHEVDGEPIDWVAPTDLLDLVPNWVSPAQGRRRCLDDLLAFLKRLTPAQQVRPGLAWVTNVCVDDGRVLIDGNSALETWLIELRTPAEALGHQPQWQHLVDTLVTAGYTRLAPYSV